MDRRGGVPGFASSPRPRCGTAVLDQELTAARVRMSVSVKRPTNDDEDQREDRADGGDEAGAGFLRLQLCDGRCVARGFLADRRIL